MDDVIQVARDRFKLCRDNESENRIHALEDLKFEQGEQWPDQVKKERNEEGRPCLTINRCPLYVRQVVNDIRQMRPVIKIRPVDNEGDPETAEVLNGMIKAIEADSDAESAYDWAAEYAVKMGWGFWRVDVEYSDDAFNQCIKINRIRNPFSVYIDPHAEKQDASDMRYAFVIERMSREAFEAKYPGKESSWSMEGTGEDAEFWFSDDSVRIAEYWEVKETPIKKHMMIDGEILEGEAPEEALPYIVATREVMKRSVIQRIITGEEVLEENEYDWKYIPLVRVVGREVDIEGRVHLKGMIRDIKDPARQYNYMRSASVERVALTPKAPYIGVKGQFKDRKWREANKKNFAYLEADMPPGAVGLPQRDAPPDVSPGLVNEIQTAAEEFKAVTGIYDAGIGARSNEVSGIAIDNRRAESDVSNFDFADNVARAMTYTGKILVDLIPKVYTGARVFTILKPGDEQEQVQLNQPYVDPQTQKPRQFMLEAGKYDAVVDIGPSYATQRKEASESMTAFITAFPQAAPIVGDLLAKNQDWPDADEVAKRLKLMLPPEIVQEENPSVAQAMNELQQQIEMGQQQMGEMQQIIQNLLQQLQDKDQELAIKQAEVERKARADQMDHVEGMTKLELEASRDLNPYGAAYE